MSLPGPNRLFGAVQRRVGYQGEPDVWLSMQQLPARNRVERYWIALNGR